MKTRISVSTFALPVLLGVLVAAIPTHGRIRALAKAGSSATQSSKVLIRSKFVPGRVMRYNLKLSGSAAWRITDSIAYSVIGPASTTRLPSASSTRSG